MIFQFIFTIAAVYLSYADGSPAYAAANARPKPEVPINLPIFAPYSAPVVPLPGSLSRFSAPNDGTRQYIPCVAPCIPLPEYAARFLPVAPPPASTNKVTPKAASVYGPPEAQRARVTEEPKEQKPEDNSYQYSYVVYDEDTGDQKAQRESSDGSKVEGQYSLIQPDGYVREVQYTADDLSGFNAVVKNFLPKTPIPSGEKKAQLEEDKKPKPEVKNSEWDISSVDLPKQSQKEQPKFKEDLKKTDDTDLLPAVDKKGNENKNIAIDGSKKIFLTYEDIIRCANLVANGKFVTAPNTENAKSPLTYIILPSLGYGKPC